MPWSGVRQLPRGQLASATSSAHRRSSTAPAAADPLPGAVEDLAVHVVLDLVGGGVAPPHRGRPAVALQVGVDALRRGLHAVEGVEDVRPAVAHAGVEDPGQEAVRLVGQPDAAQRVDGVGGVADPGEAVVPVAFAADRLRQRRGRRGDDGAVGVVVAAA